MTPKFSTWGSMFELIKMNNNLTYMKYKNSSCLDWNLNSRSLDCWSNAQFHTCTCSTNPLLISMWSFFKLNFQYFSGDTIKIASYLYRTYRCLIHSKISRKFYENLPKLCKNRKACARNTGKWLSKETRRRRKKHKMIVTNRVFDYWWLNQFSFEFLRFQYMGPRVAKSCGTWGKCGTQYIRVMDYWLKLWILGCHSSGCWDPRTVGKVGTHTVYQSYGLLTQIMASRLLQSCGCWGHRMVAAGESGDPVYHWQSYGLLIQIMGSRPQSYGSWGHRMVVAGESGDPVQQRCKFLTQIMGAWRFPLLCHHRVVYRRRVSD
jgi:hypothetical protein